MVMCLYEYFGITTHCWYFNVLQILFSFLQKGSSCDCADLITEIADTYMSLEHFDCALKFYQMLEGNLENNVRKTGLFFLILFLTKVSHYVFNPMLFLSAIFSFSVSCILFFSPLYKLHL